MAITPVTEYNIVYDTDINNIVIAINAEITRRGVGSSVSTPSQYTVVLGSAPQNMITQMATINSNHHYTGLSETTPCTSNCTQHLGCPSNSLTMTAVNSSFTAGSSKIASTTMNQIITDMNNLSNQCQCNTATTNWQACGTNVCSTVSGCCNTQCTNGCSFCADYSSHCINCSNACSPNGCNPNQSCYCNTVCSSQNVCGCNYVCSCEYY